MNSFFYLIIFNMLLPTCQYKYCRDPYFKCPEQIPEGVTRCIFHDINYLKGDNYEKRKEEVAKRFGNKLSEYSSNNMPLKFIGYCLPDISFKSKQFTEALYFNDATFYGEADFTGAVFNKEATFNEAKFLSNTVFERSEFCAETSFIETTFYRITFFYATFNGETFFRRTKFLSETSFIGAGFSGGAYFSGTKFQGRTIFFGTEFSYRAIFAGKFNDETRFNYVLFNSAEKVIFD